MFDFQLQAKTSDVLGGGEPEPSETVKKLLTQLTSYGYTTDYQEQEDGATARITINKDGKTYEDASCKLSPDLISKLARFVELCYVQFTLDELAPRMAIVGWTVRLDDRFSNERVLIGVTTSDRKITKYSPTYGEMLQLRNALDVAEVASIIVPNLSGILERGWTRMIDDGAYRFVKTGDITQVIPFNDVKKAKAFLSYLSLRESVS